MTEMCGKALGVCYSDFFCKIFYFIFPSLSARTSSRHEHTQLVSDDEPIQIVDGDLSIT